MKKLMMFLFICTLGIKSHAQVDPTLTGMIYAYTQKAEDELKSQKESDAVGDNRSFMAQRGS